VVPVLSLKTQPSAQDRMTLGRATRGNAPRSSHRRFGGTDRDPVELLERQAANRLPELTPVRYGRMLASPFAFFRGGALLMAHDLAGTPATGITVQLCGDAHLGNFGLFGSPERRLIFDLNDFDETLPGPWEWDVKRLAASMAVAGRENGFTPAERETIVRACVGRYREAMREFAAMRALDVWYAYLDVDVAYAKIARSAEASGHQLLGRSLAKARTRDSVQAMGKLTRMVDGERRIVGDPPLVVPLRDLLPDQAREDLEQVLRQLISEYRDSLTPERRFLLEQFRIVDIARKVVGVGSVGVRAWIVLLVGRDDRDPLFLQAKEAQPSVLAEYAGRSRYNNQGERVVAGQHLMQAQSDIFLGWTRVANPLDGLDRDFYVRQLKDWKFSVPIEMMLPQGMELYARLCGWTLARAHARSGDRVALAAYLGGSAKFGQAIADFAETYADQNELDYAALQAAVKDGKAEATTEI
jgi:uncharacterized protein (DUF2252 family)